MTHWEKGELTGLPMGFEIADTTPPTDVDRKAARDMQRKAIADEKAGIKKPAWNPEEWGFPEGTPPQ